MEASLSFLFMSRGCSHNRSTNLLSCFADVKLFVKSAYYAIYDIDGGTGKMISNLNEPDASRYFLDVMNERTSFASCMRSF